MPFKKKKRVRHRTYSPIRRARRYFSRPFRRHKANHKIPLLPILGLVPPMLNAYNWARPPLESGNLSGAVYNGAYSLMKDFTGYDLNENKWTGGNMVATYTGILAGFIGHKLATRFGINRYMAKIPLAGKYLEL